jgi:hypothetical protein
MTRPAQKLLVVALMLFFAAAADAAPKRKKRLRAKQRPEAAQQVETPAAALEPAPVAEPSPVPAAVVPSAHTEGAALRVTRAAAASDDLPKLEVFAGGRAFHRRLTFEDDLFESFHPYAISAPAMAFDAAVFPWRHVGFIGRGHYGVGLSSRDADGRTYSTEAYGVEAGVAGRFTTGRWRWGGGLVGGVDRFLLSAPDLPEFSGIVSTSYVFARPELSARRAVSESLALFGTFGYMVLYSAGELETTYFENLSGAGSSLSAGVLVDLGGGLEARAAVDYRRYAFEMHASPGDRFVAGGATDETVGITVGLSHKQ